MITYILLALGGVSLIFFLLLRGKEGGIVPAALKTLTSLFFVGTAIAAIVGNYNTTGTVTFSKLAFMGLVVMGLVCGLIGDFALDLKITYLESNLRHSDLYTYMGMTAFAVGHVFYIVAVGTFFGFSAWTLLIAAGSTAAIIAGSIFLMKMNFGKFLIPSVVYAFLLTLFLASTVAAGILACFSVSVILLICGAALFLLSDLALSVTYFDGNDSRLLIIVNHVLYYAAQFLIALSLLYVGLPF